MHAQYFHQDLFVAQKIFTAQPRVHIDVGSSLAGFCSHVAAFRKIEILDVRPWRLSAPNISFRRVDLMNPPTQWDATSGVITDSLSCLHALEHFGLGRYGDSIAFDGWQVGLRNMLNFLETNGTLYLSVPIGRNQEVRFNDGRIFSIPTIRDEIRKYCEITSLHVVNDEGFLLHDLDPDSIAAASTFGIEEGCAIFIAKKAVAQAA